MIMKGMAALGDTCIIGIKLTIYSGTALEYRDICALVFNSLLERFTGFFSLKNIVVVSSCIEPTMC